MPQHKGGGPQQMGMSNLGNTSGTTGVASGPAVQYLFAGGDNITLSQSLNGQSGTLTIIGASGGAGGAFQGGVSTGGNTAGDTKTVASQLVFAGGNNVTLSQSTNGASATITISGPALGAGLGETVGTVAGTDLGLTVNTDGVSIKHPNWLTTAAASNHSHGNPTLALTNLSGTTASASDGFTLSLSAANAGGAFGAGVSTGGNTSGDTKTVASQIVLAGGNNITLSQSTNGASATVTISGPNAYSAGISTNGNTSGDTGFATNRLVLVGGNNVTLSGSTNGGSMSLTISAGAGGAAGSNTLGMSNLGNTSGTTGVVSGSAVRYLFAGGNNITLSQSINGVSGTVTISGGDAVTAIGVSTGGNTESQTGMVDARMVFVGSNNITLKQAADAGFNSGTITISGANPGAQNMDFWQNMGVNGSATDAMAQTETSNGELRIFQLDIGNNIFAGNMSVKTVLLDMTFNRTATIGNFTWKLSMGLYSLNGSAMYLQYSASTALSSSQSSGASFQISSAIHGPRYLTFNGSTQFTTMNSTGGNTGAAQLTLSQGLYYMGIIAQSSSNSFSGSYFGAILGDSGQRSGTFGTSTNTGTWMGRFPWMGIYSATTNAFPQTIPNNHIQKTANAANFIPHIVFNNLQGQTIF